jgi:integrase
MTSSRASGKAAAEIKWPFGAFLQLLILTGQRRNEVAGMRWSELDLDKGLWTLPDTRAKNNKKHELPLSQAAINIIRALPRVKNVDFVFSTTGKAHVTGFTPFKARLDKLVAFSDWRLHDIRRTVASGMARLGITLPVIEKVLNHASGSFAGIVAVYQRHSFNDEKRAALESWARFVESLDKPADNVIPLRAG